MLPFLGQGAAQAIEDGATLAACLEKQRDDVPAALALPVTVIWFCQSAGFAAEMRLAHRATSPL